MTLIAALRLHEIPILIGDTLLTAPAAPRSGRTLEPTGGRELPRNYYPVNPRSAARLPDQRGYHVAGTRRKALIINGRLCIAWSGSAFSAKSVLWQLRSNFKNKNTSLRALTEFLSKQEPFKGALAVHLIGWLLDDRFHCFRWNSDWPDEIFEADEQVEGTGTAVLQRIRADEPQHVGGNLTDAYDLAQFKAAALITKCSASDVFFGLATQNLFGYFFETIFWDGTVFRYVDEITLSFWKTMRRPEDERTYTQFSPLIITYRNLTDSASFKPISRQQVIRLSMFLGTEQMTLQILIPGSSVLFL
jgi:hypothetical protein